MITIYENSKLFKHIENIILSKIPILNNLHNFRRKIKLFKDLYNEKILILEETKIMKIMNKMKLIRNSMEYNQYNDIYEVSFDELSNMIKGIDKISPSKVYKELLKIALLKDMNIDNLNGNDIIMTANLITNNIFNDDNLLGKFKDIIENRTRNNWRNNIIL